MKRNLLLIILAIVSIISTAQVIPSEYGSPPDWKNVLTFGGNGIESVIEMQKDTDGNLYVLGNFYGETSIDTQTINSEGVNSNIFLAKFNAEGVLQWVTNSDSKLNGSVNAYQFQLHGGFVYVLGDFKSEDTLSGRTLGGSGIYKDYFLAKYTLDGEVSEIHEIVFPEVTKGTPRLSINASNGVVLLAKGNEIHKLEQVGMSLLKSFDANLVLTDVHYSNDTIFITGEITQTVLIDSIQLDYTGGRTGLVYAAIGEDQLADWGHVFSYDLNTGFMKLSKLGKFNEKNGKLYLAGATSGNATVNNTLIKPLGDNDNSIFPFIINVNKTDGLVNDLVRFPQDKYETLDNFVKEVNFLYDENDELTFLYRVQSTTTLNKVNFKEGTFNNVSTSISGNDKSIFGLNGEEIKSKVNLDNLHLTITKFINNDEQWSKELISENSENSTVVDVISDNDNHYYALIKDGRKINTAYNTKHTLIKVDYNNNVIWSKKIEGDFMPVSGIGESISFSDGVLTLAGNMKGELVVGNTFFTTTNEDLTMLMVAKFSSEGVITNSATMIPPDGEKHGFYDVASLDNGKVVVCQSLNTEKARIILFNSDLTVNKTAEIKAERIIYLLDATKGENGKTFIVGELVGDTVTYGGEVLNKPQSDETKNGNNVFFELDKDFNFLNVFNYGHAPSHYNNSSWPTSIVTKGDVKFIGGFAMESKEFVFGDIKPSFDSRAERWNHYYAKLNSNNEFDWVKTIGSDDRFFNYSSIDFDTEGNLYVSGRYQGTLFINENIELNKGYENGQNTYIIKYSGLGEVEWVKTFAASGTTNASGVAVNNEGEIAVGGYYRGVGSFSKDKQFAESGSSQGYIAIIKGDDTLGLEKDIVLNKNMRLYPNPSNGVFTIDTSLLSFSDTKAYTQVFDVQGRIVYSKTRGLQNKQLNLNLDKCAKGVYFVKMTDGTHTYTNKIILE
ncbi:conserved protein of unknown function precursor containing a T9SS type A C-terminal secretion signal [Tenacibaculum sp. 190524A02b]|uniref:T9SS type A sorting domain-containing protein n=1 Tax=Tenacibaculum vairaonense TaxID=3137860 RepID=UPI0032B2C8A9